MAKAHLVKAAKANKLLKVLEVDESSSPGHLLFISFGDDKTVNTNNEYEDDYYETSEFDTIHIDEEYDGDATKPTLSQPASLTKKKSLHKKKKRLEDWLEEKRLRDELGEDNPEP